MAYKIKKLSKTAVASIFISSLLNRLSQTVAGAPAAKSITTSPDSYNSLTFLHEFIDNLELNKPATMLTAAARKLARLNPDTSAVLICLQNGNKSMVLTGAKPSPFINTQILALKNKFQISESPIKSLNESPDLPGSPSTNYCENLTVAAATDSRLKANQLIFYSTASPTTQERQLLNYCLQHLDKRLTEARNLRELEKSNLLDSLTGLNNRRHFDEIIKKESARADRYHRPTSLIMLDLDFFKKVNDTFGHPTGDLVLQTLGKILLEEVRQSDTPCRYGGEEFAIVLPETDLYEAQKIGERFRQLIEKQNIITHNNINLKITASIGIASTEELHNIDLVTAADQALYMAKEQGRNQVATSPLKLKPAVEPMIKHCFPRQAVLNGGQ